MEPWDIIRELEADASRLYKENIIKRVATEGNSIFFEGCVLALDKLVSFGVKQIDITVNNGPGLSWEEFLDLSNQLQTRNLTGYAARDAIDNAMSLASADQWNFWYRRILIKDLRCGVSDKTINKIVEKAHPSYKIPVFTCQLAHDGVKYESKVQGKRYLDTKMDGVRLLTVVYPDGEVYQYSRNGKEMLNFQHIREQFSTCAEYFDEPYVFDGEVMSSSFQDLMKSAFRKDQTAGYDAFLQIFDILPLSAFHNGRWDVKQSDRFALLDKWHADNLDNIPAIKVISRVLVDLDTPEGYEQFKEINKIALDGGFEGIMVKDPDASYELKRSYAWLKIKPFIEISLEIIGVEEGEDRNTGRLGAFVFSGVEDEKYIEVNVGGGYTDKQRIEFWENRVRMIGMIGEIRADAITKSQDSDSYSLRFPRFLRFRGFDKGEKL